MTLEELYAARHACVERTDTMIPDEVFDAWCVEFDGWDEKILAAEGTAIQPANTRSNLSITGPHR